MRRFATFSARFVSFGASFSLVSLVGGLAHRVSAAPTPQESSLADSLFKEGNSLMKAGKVDAACDKYQESQRIEAGGGTILKLADCREKQGRIATAYVLFQEALALAKQARRDDRERTARERLATLEPKLSRITVTVTSEADGLEVKVDATLIPKTAWGTPWPVDPGVHDVFATAREKRPWKTSVTILPERDDKRVVVPKLEDAPPPTSPAASSGATKTTSEPPIREVITPATADRSPSHTASHDGRTVSYVVAGVGVVLVGGGIFFTLRAQSAWDDARRINSDGKFAEADARRDDARSALTWGRVTLVGGVVALGVAGFLYFAPLGGESSTSSLRIAPTVGTTTRGLTVSGAF